MTVRTNLVTNPSFETNTTGWNISGGTMARVTSPAGHSGAYCLEATKTSSSGFISLRGNSANWLPLVSGQTYTVSFYHRVSSNIPKVPAIFAIFNSSGSFLGTTGSLGPASTTTEWTRSSYTRTADSILSGYPTGAYIAPATNTGGSVDVGFKLYIDAVLLEVSSTLGAYFDGDTSDEAYVYEWTGTDHASTSTETTTTPPTISTGTVTNITSDSITITTSGVTANPDSRTINSYGVVYSTSPNPTIADSSQVGTGTSADFDNTIIELTEGATYYIRAYAQWGTDNYVYGTELSRKIETQVVKKRYIYKVYNPSSNFLTEWTDEVVQDISLTRQINSLTSELVIKLGRSATDYGEGDDVDFNNIVKIYIEDYENTTPELFFQGYIANYNPVFGSDERVEVSLFSFDSTLDGMVHGADEIADQTQATTDGNYSFSLDIPIAQSFVPDVTPITSVDVKLSVASTQNITMTIETDNSGQPSGTALTNGTVTKRVSSTSLTTNKFIFSDGVTVTPATTYWIVLKGQS